MSSSLASAVASLAASAIAAALAASGSPPPSAPLGAELSVPQRLADGQEYQLSTKKLFEKGRELFAANWTIQEGAGRPLTKGTGAPLADNGEPLSFPHNMNRVSGPDANSCAGCHNAPYGIPGGGGDFVANVFVLGQRFDFATFDAADTLPTKGTAEESGAPTTLQTIANSRATLGMFGSGYIEMLARQITADLQAIRDTCAPGQTVQLVSKGIDYGTLSRDGSGNWITTGVDGLVRASLATSGPSNPPSLVIRPFHQASNVVSLRQFTNNAMNHHHGIQTTERFGPGIDADGDGVVDEMSVAEVTAVSVFQAGMAVPGRVIPKNPAIEAAVLNGEELFLAIGCAECHIPSLPLDDEGWIFSEPNPYNPSGNLQLGQAPTLTIDLSSNQLPEPRLKPKNGVVMVPCFTDFKVHDICDGPSDPNREELDMNAPAGSADFFAGNERFLTRKLWGVANEAPYFHHGLHTTMREAILAHSDEALASRQAFEALSEYDRNSVIEFLKTLQVLPPGTKHTVVDQNFKKRNWNGAF